MNSQYLYKKEVDWSTLNYGISIPYSLQSVFYNSLNLTLQHGESRKIKILINATEYDATISNNKFDKNKYNRHKDILQIRYSPQSNIAKYLRTCFIESLNYIMHKRANISNSRSKIIIPEESKEFVDIYATNIADVFIFEILTANEILSAKNQFSKFNEFDLEMIMNMEDDSTGIIDKISTLKVRKLDMTICNKLKHIYDYSCQICGEKIGEKYNTNFIHAHHIEPFSKSLNNNPENIMIVCPNHHGLIHTAHPVFDIINKEFKYENGYIENLKLNYHL